MANLHDYSDYRKYLKDFYQKQKQKNPGYSYRVFANKAKLASPNYLKLVIDGKRRITEKTIHQFARGLGLGKQDAQYFKSLVFYQESADLEAKNVYLDEMIRLRRKSTGQARELTRDRDEVLLRWYHWAIREMVMLKDFHADGGWLSKQLKNRITPKEAEESLALLKRLELIKLENGRWVQCDPMLATTDEMASMLVKNIHRQFIELGVDSIFKDPIEEREVSGLTLAISRSQLPEIKQAIKSFRKDLNRIFTRTEPDADEVYHLVINFFPLTGKGRNP